MLCIHREQLSKLGQETGHIPIAYMETLWSEGPCRASLWLDPFVLSSPEWNFPPALSLFTAEPTVVMSFHGGHDAPRPRTSDNLSVPHWNILESSHHTMVNNKRYIQKLSKELQMFSVLSIL